MSSPQTPQQIPFEESEDFKQHYANSIQVKMSLWDMEMVFGVLQIPMVQGGPVSVMNWGSVHISPQQAKALAAVLSQNVTQYENNFGPISLKAWVPPGTEGHRM